jgi:DNA-binding CsgD family transcriptional regulator
MLTSVRSTEMINESPPVITPNAAAPGAVAGPTVELKRLTPSEQKVADMVATGRSNAEIARMLGISRHTVESHLKHVFAKLGITSRLKLAVLVLSAAA